MKFTEEQYREIVQIAEEYTDFWRQYAFSTLGSRGNTNIYMQIREKVSDDQSMKLALAIANPMTREYAHKQFVEKPKKYVWKLEGTDYKIHKHLGGAWFLARNVIGETHLTEQEIENSPFKPEWFYKEEVE